MLNEHLTFVRANSPFYKNAWREVWPDGKQCPGLENLPITDHASYWAANGTLANTLLTAPQSEGVVFKSGGTTGNPKFSFFSNADWREFCHVFGGGFRRLGIQPSERIANLFYGGQLYASLFFFGRCLEESGVGVHFPLAGFAPPDEVVKTFLQFHISSLAGVPTTILNLLPHFAEPGRDKLDLRRIIFAGEAMYPDQASAIRKVFPDCQIQSAGVAGVDYGELGWASDADEPGVHHLFPESAVLEILDETNQPVQETGVEGAIHVTNFRRRLMPVVRYPVGDMGMWLDPPDAPDRRFKLLGRSAKGARVGPMTLYLEDFMLVLKREAPETGFTSFQLLVDHHDHKDRCTLRVAVPDPAAVPEGLSNNLIEALYAERHMFPDMIRDNVVHPLAVEWITSAQLLTNPRTGKMLQLLDRRHDS